MPISSLSDLATARMVAMVRACVMGSPWLMFRRKTLTPARASRVSMAVEFDTGPTVATIRVRLRFV